MMRAMFLVVVAVYIGGMMAHAKLSRMGDVVVDTFNGLVWQDNITPVKKTWKEAIEYCESLVIDDFNDWRLPNISELMSIALIDKDGNSLPDTFKYRTDPKSHDPYNSYFSSTTVFPGYGTLAYVLNGKFGKTGSLDKNKDAGIRAYVKCVCGGHTDPRPDEDQYELCLSSHALNRNYDLKKSGWYAYADPQRLIDYIERNSTAGVVYIHGDKGAEEYGVGTYGMVIPTNYATEDGFEKPLTDGKHYRIFVKVKRDVPEEAEVEFATGNTLYFDHLNFYRYKVDGEYKWLEGEFINNYCRIKCKAGFVFKDLDIGLIIDKVIITEKDVDCNSSQPMKKGVK